MSRVMAVFALWVWAQACVASIHHAAASRFAQSMAASLAPVSFRHTGSWIRAGGLAGGRVLYVQGRGPLVVTRLGPHPLAVRCARMRILSAGTQPAILFAAQAAFFRAAPAGAVAGTEAALLWPVAGARFTHLWIRGGRPLRVYGLLQGPAYRAVARFVIRERRGVSMVVHLAVFPRRLHGIVGISPLVSRYWYGWGNHVPAQALYPAVHDADGALVKVAGAAVWQPLADPRHTLDERVVRRRAHVFALLQRDRVSSHYGHVRARYQDRPGVQVTMPADPAGQIDLRESPWCGQRNVLLYWRSAGRLPQGAFALRYTLRWGWHAGGDCRQGCVITTLVGGNAVDRDRKYLIEYQGVALDRMALSAVRAHVTTMPRTVITENRLERNPYTGGFRQVITVAPVAGRVVRLRAWLGADSRVVSEIWQYRMRPGA